MAPDVIEMAQDTGAAILANADANLAPSPEAPVLAGETDTTDVADTTAGDGKPADAAHTVALTITSAQRSQVTIDGENAGFTPLTLDLPAREGTRTVRLSRDGHITETRRVPADRDHTLKVQLRKQDEGFMLPP
jgi:hypothetical protein